MLVADIMSRDVLAFAPDTPVSEIARLLLERGVNGAPVVDASGKPVGIVTLADLIVRNANLHFPRYLKFLDSIIYLEDTSEYEEEVRKALASVASELMSANPDTITPDSDITDAATLLFEHGVNALPVVQDDRLVGILSRSDIVRLMVREAASPSS